MKTRISILSAALCAAFMTQGASADVPVFEEKILPILELNCVGCHGAMDPQAGLRMDGIAELSKGGANGPAVVPGKSGESPLYRLAAGLDTPKMPPDPLLPLSDEELELIKQWIDGGTPSIESPKGEVDTNGETEAAAPEPETVAPPEPETPPAPEPADTPEPEISDYIPAEPLALAPETIEGLEHSRIGSLAFDPKGKILAVGRLYITQLFEVGSDYATLKLIANLPGHSHLVRALDFSSGGSLLAAAGGRPGVGGEVVVWDVESLKEVARVNGHADNVYAVQFSPDGKTLATCAYDRLIKLWDAGSGEEIRTLKDHVDAVYDLAFSPDGSRLASAAGDRTVKIWDPASGKRLYTLSDAENELYTLAFHPSGRLIAAAGLDKMIRVWELGETIGVLKSSKFAHEGAILRLAYSEDGSVLYSAAEDKRIKGWNTETFLDEVVFEPQPDWVYGFDLTGLGGADAQWMAAGRYDGSLALYDARTGENLNAAIQNGAKSKQLSMAEENAVTVEETAAGDPDTAEEVQPAEPADEGDPFRVGVLAGTGTYPSWISSISPKAAARGETVEFAIHGKNLDGAEVIADGPGIEVVSVENEKLPMPKFTRSEFTTGTEIVDTGRPHKLTVKLAIGEDAPEGVRRVRVRTPLALTNAQSFMVEAVAAQGEKENNDTPADAQPVVFPGIAAGSMDQMGDVDCFAFEAAAGDELVFEALGRALGSGLNPVMELLGPDGTELASSLDFGDGDLLAHRFEAGGHYVIRITDEFLQAGGFYRLNATRRPLITRAFPLGVQRGESRDILIEGYNLGGQSRAEASIPADYASNEYSLRFENEAGSLVRPVKLAVSDHAPVYERGDNDSIQTAMAVEAPAAIHGYIYNSQTGRDEDYYRFEAKKGEPLIVDVAAERLGSPVDSVVEIFHADGRPVEIATVRCVAETFVTLSDRDARSAGIRLDSWKDLEINDYMMIGSEIIRISSLPDYPDEDVGFHNNSRFGWRYGYFGTTPGHHAVDTKAYKVQIHPPGQTFPPNGMPVYRLFAKNDDGGAPLHRKDSYFRFEPPEDGAYVVKIADARGRQGAENAYQLEIRRPAPDFRIYTDTDLVNIPKGGRHPVRVLADRLDGFDGEINVEIAGLPDGYKSTLGRILPGEESVSLLIEAEPGAESTGPDARFSVNAYAALDGKLVSRQSSIGALNVVNPPDIVAAQEPAEVVLAPGGTAKITVRAERHNGFEGRIPIGVSNLPHGVYVLDTGLNGILVNEDETERTFTVYAEPWVRDMAMPVFSVVNVETRSPLPNRNATNVSILRIDRSAGEIAGGVEFLQQKRKF